MKNLSLFTLLTFTSLFSQTSYNVSLYDRMDKYSGGVNDNDYSEVWGWTDTLKNREYAFIGTSSGTSIVDITTKPIKEVSFRIGPPSTYNYHEFRTYRNYLYIGAEGSDISKNAGIQIVDLSPLPDSTVLKKVYIWIDTNSSTGAKTNYYRAHTVSIEKNFLYLNGGNFSGTRILDVADPLNPLQVGSYKSKSNLPYVHDAYIRNDTMYAACIDNGSIDIVDFTQKGYYTQATSSKVVSITPTVPEKRTHQVWLSDDSRFMFVATEIIGGNLHVYDISNRKAPIQVATWTSDTAVSIHNVFVKGDFIYIAYYGEGFRVLDIKNPANPIEVAFYDTYPGPHQPPHNATFYGAWGVYPYFPSGKIAVSDMNTGLYIFDVNLKPGGKVTGIVRDAATQQILSGVEVAVQEMGRKYKTDANGRFTYGSAEGKHSIKFSKAGYTAKIETLQTTPAGLDTFTITLTPGAVTSVIDRQYGIPDRFELSQNFPNPFNPNTTISFSVGSDNRTSLHVYNTLGQEIRTLIDLDVSKGKYSVSFDAVDLPSGLYFYTLRSGSFSTTKKMMLAK